jgi:tetratricopeptide (TPR) repeat protein
VLEIAPGYPRGLIALGLSQLARGSASEADATYQELLKSSGAGAADFAKYALADLYLFRGRAGDAAALVEGALSGELSASARARVHLLLADTRLAQGRAADAIKAAEAAVTGSPDPQIRYGAAQILIRAGRAPQALAIIRPLVDAVDTPTRVLGALAQGEAYLASGRGRDALAGFQEAQKLTDSWLGRFGLARAYIALQMYPEAATELDRCWTRRGEATALFLDDIPTWRITPLVHYHQGVARAGFGNSTGAAEAFKTFADIKAGGDEKSAEVADAQKRAAPR